MSFLKNFVPYIFYILAFFFLFQNLSGKPKWTLFFLVWLLPLRNVIDRLQSMPLGKDFTDFLFLFLIIGWVIQSVSQKQKIFNRSALNVVLVFLIIYTFISLIRGYSYLYSYTAFHISDDRLQLWKNYIMLPMLFFITFNIVKDKKTIWQLVVVIIFSIIVMNWYTVRQILWFSSIESRTKIHGTFQYLGPNEIAAFYNQYTVILIALFFAVKKHWYKLVLLILIGLNIFCVLFLFSRAAYIGLVLGLFFILAFRKPVLLIPLIIIAISWQTFLPQKVKDRINMTTDEYGNLDESNRGRIRVWEESLEIFKQNPIFGAGFGVFGHLGFELGDTHNIYLKVLSEQGLIGIFIFLLLLATMFFQGMALYRDGPDDLSKALGIGFAACIITLMVNNAFGDRWTYTEVSSNLWVFAALVSRLVILTTSEKKKGEVLYGSRKHIDPNKI